MLQAGQLGVAGCRHGAIPRHEEEIDAEASNDGTAGQMLALLWHLHDFKLLAAMCKFLLCVHMMVHTRMPSMLSSTICIKMQQGMHSNTEPAALPTCQQSKISLCSIQKARHACHADCMPLRTGRRPDEMLIQLLADIAVLAASCTIIMAVSSAISPLIVAVLAAAGATERICSSACLVHSHSTLLSHCLNSEPMTS